MPKAQEDGTSYLVAGIEHAKRHPVVVAVAAVMSLVFYFTSVGDLYVRAADAVHDWRHPYEKDYQQLAAIDLGVTPEHLDERLGKAQRSVDLCEMFCTSVATRQPLIMKMYESELVAVRALFVESSLEWYAVTLLSDTLEPPMTWLGHDLGTLGRTTFTDALDVAGVEPTDVDMFLGPQSASYVELFAAGGLADYRGVFLASAPYGSSGSFDRSAADAVLELNDRPYDAQIADAFRSGSVPNTFGEFMDDGGLVSELAHDAEFHRVLLYEFTFL